jgi:RNA polymerase sigma-70 factor (ECF subfamily)
VETLLDAKHLSQLSTDWRLLGEAHGDAPEARARAQAQLAHRYQGAVRLYLTRMRCPADVVDEITQRFFLQLLQGGLRCADPDRGRFRSLVKTVLWRLLARYRQEGYRAPRPLAPDEPALAGLAAPDEEPAFEEVWRDELLARTWKALARENPSYFEVLRRRAAQPDVPSHRLVEQMNQETGEARSAAAFRKTLERARERFVRLLIDEVAATIDSPTPEAVRAELAELKLLELLEDGQAALEAAGAP